MHRIQEKIKYVLTFQENLYFISKTLNACQRYDFGKCKLPIIFVESVLHHSEFKRKIVPFVKHLFSLKKDQQLAIYVILKPKASIISLLWIFQKYFNHKGSGTTSLEIHRLKNDIKVKNYIKVFLYKSQNLLYKSQKLYKIKLY